jgi:hypothetical protein
MESLPLTDRWYINGRVESLPLTNMRYINGWVESLSSTSNGGGFFTRERIYMKKTGFYIINVNMFLYKGYENE